MIKDLHNLLPEDWAMLYADNALEPDEVAFVETELQKYPDILAKVEKMREFNAKLIDVFSSLDESIILAKDEETQVDECAKTFESAAPIKQVDTSERYKVFWDPDKIKAMEAKLKLFREPTNMATVKTGVQSTLDSLDKGVEVSEIIVSNSSPNPPVLETNTPQLAFDVLDPDEKEILRRQLSQEPTLSAELQKHPELSAELKEVIPDNATSNERISTVADMLSPLMCCYIPGYNAKQWFLKWLEHQGLNKEDCVKFLEKLKTLTFEENEDVFKKLESIVAELKEHSETK